jgi:hypothetical protein
MPHQFNFYVILVMVTPEYLMNNYSIQYSKKNHNLSKSSSVPSFLHDKEREATKNQEQPARRGARSGHKQVAD